jgi:hypothetical protein
METYDDKLFDLLSTLDYSKRGVTYLLLKSKSSPSLFVQLNKSIGYNIIDDIGLYYVGPVRPDIIYTLEEYEGRSGRAAGVVIMGASSKKDLSTHAYISYNGGVTWQSKEISEG